MDGQIQGSMDGDNNNKTSHMLKIPISFEMEEPGNSVNNKSNHENGKSEQYPMQSEIPDEELSKCDAFKQFYSSCNGYYRYFTWIFINTLVIVYFVFATLHWRKNNSITCNYNWCNGYGMLIILIVLTYGSLLYFKVLKKVLRRPVGYLFSSVSNCINAAESKLPVCCSFETVFVIILSISLLIFIIIDSLDSTERLTSLIGVVVLTILTLVFSKHPSRINWRPVVSGFLLQFIFGIIVIRWSFGRSVLQCISNKVAAFLDLSIAGASFVYSDNLVNNHIFAFSALPVIFFMSFTVQILYYLGIMQWTISKLGWLLQKAMGTTVCESMNASANIFLGMTESPLLIKPYISKLTKSEIHAVMCCGFATVSGTVMAAYISYGADPTHLISASIMSAPAALCFSKLFYPETETSLTSYKSIKLEKSNDSSVLDAATKGAVAAIPLVLNIIANIVAFISFVTFCDSLIEWSAELVGYSGINLQVIMGKICMPLSWIMGIPWEECEKVGKLIGIKTVVNEFVAFQKLGELKQNGLLSPRSGAIATYAICGFSNPGSVGILIGGLSSLAPEKTNEITSVAMRAFIAGSFVCFLTACIAGLLITDEFVA